MRYFVFKLSMPNVGSWNGKWTGADNFYCRARSYAPKSEKIKNVLASPNHYYNFGDGWGTSINVEECTAKEAARFKRISVGFFGYDWMIDEIEEYGRILTLKERDTKQGCINI